MDGVQYGDHRSFPPCFVASRATVTIAAVVTRRSGSAAAPALTWRPLISLGFAFTQVAFRIGCELPVLESIAESRATNRITSIPYWIRNHGILPNSGNSNSPINPRKPPSIHLLHKQVGAVSVRIPKIVLNGTVVTIIVLIACKLQCVPLVG
jgi:hypothetical protein